MAKIIWFKKPCKEDVIIAFCLYLLNVFDAFCTIKFVSEGKAAEANPFMAFLMSVDMNLFLFAKMVPTLAFIAFLLFLNVPRKVNSGLMFLLGVYLSLAFYYLSWR